LHPGITDTQEIGKIISHFTVTVVLDGERAAAALTEEKSLDSLLSEALAPYDENVRGPRRVNQMWMWAEGETPFGDDPTGRARSLSWVSDEVKETNTWEALHKYLGEDDEDYELDPQARTLTEFTTYNEKSKWDWWVVGGRWPHYFMSKGTGSKVNYVMAHDLDVEGMQDAAMQEAQRLWTRFNEEIFAIYGRPIGWSEFVKRVEDENDPLTIEQARLEYHRQDAIREVRARHDDADFGHFVEVEPYLASLGDHLAEKRAGAVPTYALLTKEGEWDEPGHMGWFGLSSETEATQAEYREAYMKYVANLNPTDVLVCIDAHI
jgi:hypothetical protein